MVRSSAAASALRAEALAAAGLELGWLGSGLFSSSGSCSHYIAFNLLCHEFESSLNILAFLGRGLEEFEVVVIGEALELSRMLTLPSSKVTLRSSTRSHLLPTRILFTLSFACLSTSSIQWSTALKESRSVTS